MEAMKESDKELLIRLCEQGESFATIKRLLPYKTQQIEQEIALLRQKGALKTQKQNRRENIQARVFDAYNRNFKFVTDIVRETGLSAPTVRSVLKSNNIILKKKKHYEHKKTYKLSERTQAIINGLKEGKNMCCVAKENSVSRQYVFKVKKRFLKIKEINEDG